MRLTNGYLCEVVAEQDRVVLAEGVVRDGRSDEVGRDELGALKKKK